MIIFLSTIEQQIPYPRHQNNLIIDETVFIRITENDMAAFEEFYRLTECSVYAFVLSILKNHDDTLDVM